MSGPKPRQQKSRSAKDGFKNPDAKPVEDKYAGHEASYVVFDDLADNDEGEDDDGEYS